VRSTGCDARGSRDLVKRLDDAIDGRELGREDISIEMLERVLPVDREATAEVRLDFRDEELVRPAEESVDHLLLAEDPTQFGENSHVDADGEALAVHQHAVTIEDHEFDRASHPRLATCLRRGRQRFWDPTAVTAPCTHR
jgi:hypothetical protein